MVEQDTSNIWIQVRVLGKNKTSSKNNWNRLGNNRFHMCRCRNWSSFWCINNGCSKKSIIKRTVVFLCYIRICICWSHRFIRTDVGFPIAIRGINSTKANIYIILVHTIILLVPLIMHLTRITRFLSINIKGRSVC